MKYTILTLFALFAISCTSQQSNKLVTSAESSNEKIGSDRIQIGQYVVNIVEDSKGNLWFGTLENGVACYDGKALRYFTTEDGLPANRVVRIVEDDQGIMWFGTGLGLSKYDGQSFTNFSVEEGLCDNMVSNLFIDSKGIMWIGTWGGVCTYDGNKFIDFPLPYPEMETQINPDTKDWITEIMEDSDGNMWIGRDGYGAAKYDGESFVHYSTKDGLHSSNVNEIIEDKDGNLWFGSRVAERDNPDPNHRSGKGGVNKFDGNQMINFPKVDGFNDGDVYTIYRDPSDILWISTTRNGMYKYDGSEFKHYDVPVSVMSIKEDKHGNVWMGAAGGLYRIADDGIVNITTAGPWK